jgi:hypothetical protein
MTLGWKIWTIYLMIVDLIAAIGLWRQKTWGIALFLLIACSQLVAYIGFSAYFGNQPFLVGFHALSLLLFILIASSMRLKARSTE